MRILLVSLMAAAAAIPLVLAAQQTGERIDVPAGSRIVLQVKGDGAQVYTCSVEHDGAKWILKAPDAKLLDATGKTIGSHFAGPTWKLEDGSQVQGELIASQPATDANSVAWLLLRAKSGTAKGALGDVAFVQRTETHGGVAAKAGCGDAGDAGKTIRVPYTATYTFYAEK
jgi:hypothetical protein